MVQCGKAKTIAESDARIFDLDCDVGKRFGIIGITAAFKSATINFLKTTSLTINGHMTIVHIVPRSFCNIVFAHMFTAKNVTQRVETLTVCYYSRPSTLFK